jgi:hypothetical protein
MTKHNRIKTRRYPKLTRKDMMGYALFGIMFYVFVLSPEFGLIK